MKVQFKTDLLWHILFTDLLILSLRQGGLSVVDMTVHAGFLVAATAALLAHHRFHEIPRWFYFVFGPVLLIGLIQLIPLPESLMPILAPIKWRTGSIAAGLYSDVTFSTQITMMPQLHTYKLAIFALDVYVLALMLLAPAPSWNTVRGWLFSLALILGVLATVEGKGFIDETSILSYYMGTYGGFVNPNHFGCMAALLAVVLFSQVLILLRRALRTFQKVKPVPIEDVVRKVLGAIALFGAMLMIFSGFRLVYSRSGVIDMAIALGIFGFVLLLTYRGTKRVLVWGLALPVIFVFALLIPGEAAMRKFETEGLSERGRIDFLMSGLGFLKEMPLLGVGLGSTEAILNQVTPQAPYRAVNVREFHNDFLQTLVELGPVGLICLLMFLYWFIHEAILRTREKRFEGRALGAAMIGAILMLCFHSAVSFPLRITSIRLLMLMLLVIFLRQRDTPRLLTRSAALRFLPLLLIATTLITSQLPKALGAENAGSYFEERALRHGRFAEASLLAANEELADIFDHNPPITYTQERMPYIHAQALEHLRGQVFSVKGLGILFMLEIIEDRIQHPDFDPARFQQLKDKARIIGDLGMNNNNYTIAPWMFLYATYAPSLDEEEQAAFNKIRSEWHYRYYPQQLKHFPETKHDWIAPPSKP